MGEVLYDNGGRVCMLFSSVIFLFWFLPITVLVYFCLPLRVLKNLWLLAVSLFFYAWGEPIFVFVMILSILFNYTMGLLADRYRENERDRRLVLTVMITVNVSVFFVFKYWDFTAKTINDLLGTDLPFLQLGLPIGISFFTFQAMSYVIDVYRDPKKSPVQINPLWVGLYISLFPQLIAGPIVRYQTIAKEIKTRRETVSDSVEGILRFMTGLSKKVLIANNMAIVADLTFSQDLRLLSSSLAWLGAVAYSLQIYYDFSAYSDMAIGLGKIFGFHFLENFDYPYTAKSVTDFWRKWHISLSSWFRDYVYIPLGGSKRGKGITFRNLFFVWLLTGIWHGASWNFIAWGLYYFVFLSFEKFLLGKNGLKKLEGSVISRVYTMITVICGWVLFRSSDLGYATEYLGRMFLWSSPKFMQGSTVFYFREYALFFVAALVFSFPLSSYLQKRLNNAAAGIRFLYFAGRNTLYFASFYLSVIDLLKGTYNPFIYFNF